VYEHLRAAALGSRAAGHAIRHGGCGFMGITMINFVFSAVVKQRFTGFL
jgi:hypothetical protein